VKYQAVFMHFDYKIIFKNTKMYQVAFFVKLRYHL